MLEEIREIIREHARLPVDVDLLQPEDDLYRSGMTSHAGVNVMLAIEERFDVEFPDQLLTRATFSTLTNIERSVAELRSAR